MKSLTDWHRWYAWHPIKIDGSWHWLSWVMRKGEYVREEDFGYWNWEYQPSTLMEKSK